MKKYIKFLPLLIIFAQINSVIADINVKADSPPLSARASYLSGPYSGSWQARVAPDGHLSVTVSHRIPVSGQTFSNYLSNTKRIENIRRSLEEADYFSLPSELPTSSNRRHEPRYKIVIVLGNTEYSVVASDPEMISSEDYLRRFFLVWDSIYADAEFKPDRFKTANK
jgi:hypothetical protein